jgi:hypothetical protein
VEAVAGLQIAHSLRLADVQAVRGDGGRHALVVQAGGAKSAAQDEGEEAAGSGKQVPTVELDGLPP